MAILIINTFLVISSLAVIVYNYNYIRTRSHKLEYRIKTYLFSGIELFLFGTVSIILSFILVKEMELSLYAIIGGLISIIIYIIIISLWNKLFKSIDEELDKIGVKDKQNPNTYYGIGHRFKSINIYGLMYAFSIFFYLLSLISYFKL